MKSLKITVFRFEVNLFVKVLVACGLAGGTLLLSACGGGGGDTENSSEGFNFDGVWEWRSTNHRDQRGSCNWRAVVSTLEIRNNCTVATSKSSEYGEVPVSVSCDFSSKTLRATAFVATARNEIIVTAVRDNQLRGTGRAIEETWGCSIDFDTSLDLLER